MNPQTENQFCRTDCYNFSIDNRHAVGWSSNSILCKCTKSSIRREEILAICSFQLAAKSIDRSRAHTDVLDRMRQPKRITGETQMHPKSQCK
ncbi:hypothetical protein T4D_11152 [Trichinella pseudospiralis]|uniref:Uncharacterized protein n=1 Tax=Trichinella pseudospiralis TaxID=6337 RepID=A0A0V1FI74_TRIPS|nr:hypothetical protein T4D_11152 [Trichinella pseudospiralis]